MRNALDKKMRRLIVICVFLIRTLTSYSQTDSVNVWINVTNKADNDSWYDKLMTLDKRQQLKLIHDRLLRDTIVLKSDTSRWTVYSPTQRLEIDLYCRPLIKINGQDILIEKPDQAKQIAKVLVEIDFRQIQIVKPDIAKEKYGKWGLCGVILLTTKDKRINDIIKNMGL